MFHWYTGAQDRKLEVLRNGRSNRKQLYKIRRRFYSSHRIILSRCWYLVHMSFCVKKHFVPRSPLYYSLALVLNVAWKVSRISMWSACCPWTTALIRICDDGHLSTRFAAQTWVHGHGTTEMLEPRDTKYSEVEGSAQRLLRERLQSQSAC